MYINSESQKKTIVVSSNALLEYPMKLSGKVDAWATTKAFWIRI